MKQDLLTALRDGLTDASTGLAIAPPAALPPLLDRFLAAYARRPLVANRHGSGFNDSLWLWMLAAWLRPGLFVESGSFMGHSAWLFRSACPEATVVTHDVELPAAGRLRTPGVTYHLHDWSDTPLAEIDPRPRGRDGALIFFDDHLSHARRLREASQRGFDLALFDDNFPAWQLHATGAPPLPSLAMLLDDDGVTKDIEWQRKGKHYGYALGDALVEERAAARALVAAQVHLPDLSPITRLPPGSNLTLVRLKQ
ncbi:MAG: hypothetical protein Kilf2KO_40760 [Rhodospirillales bacterium]